MFYAECSYSAMSVVHHAVDLRSLLELVACTKSLTSLQASIFDMFLFFFAFIQLFLQTKHIGFILEAVFALELGLALQRYEIYL